MHLGSEGRAGPRQQRRRIRIATPDITEDRRPKYLDLIHFDGSNGWEEIRSVTNWDMSFFGEQPDFLLVT